MQAHIVLTGTAGKWQNRRRLIAAIGGTMLALTAVAGLARWQATMHDGAQGATTAAARPPAAALEPAGNASVAGRDTARRGVRGSTVHSLYIVGSHGDADFIMRALAQEGPLTGAADEPLVRRSVVVVASDAEAARVTALMTGEPRLTDGTRELPVVRVFDLRLAPAALSAAVGTS